MTDKVTFKMRTAAADFEVLSSSFYTIAGEMGLAMARTARSPIFFASHDFVTAVLSPRAELISLAEYIPVLVGATPFAVKAVTQFFGDDINPGDVFLVNDPYSLEAGNHLADWGVVYPVFYKERLKFMLGQKAHQIDTGGGVPGGYNPNAIDIWAEGLRIPPVRIFSRGHEVRDVLNLILTNVRIYEAQRGDLLSLIGASRVGERRLMELMDKHGEETIDTFIEDLLNYSEFRVREQIDKVPDGTYHGETKGIGDAPPIVADITIKGSDMIVDLRKSGPQIKEFINSPIANTYSSVWLALLTSLGKKIERQYRNAGCFRPVKILTTPGSIVHATSPSICGQATNFVAKQIIEVTWEAISKAVPKAVPAGWGSINSWVFSGIDPRRQEGYGAPDFCACANGAGAIWGTDGWSAAVNAISSGTCWPPEIEIVESRYPIFMERWELASNSAGPGKWRGGFGVHNSWVADSGAEPIYLAACFDPCVYKVTPAIAGGKLPPPNSKRIIWAGGGEETNDDTLQKKFYILHSDDKVVDWSTGGAGVGDPLEREIEAVQEEVRDKLITIESARDDYGVVIDPVTFKVDPEQTERLRRQKRLD